MNIDTRIPLKVHEETRGPFLEIINAEKKLWSLIYSKGLLHEEAPNLYLKVRTSYEKLILSKCDDVEFQEVEFSLWKLHYKHIDEFRKRIRQSSTNNERFKSFLSEASEFYENLISKIRKFYGLLEDPISDETRLNLRKYNYSCHRLLVCLGDLARYREELSIKIDNQKQNWSAAATHYFKAVSIWPDSGNPQNQLALLATRNGDDFLALYHCVRSLAVKEPFPDAWGNLMLLFDKNRSSQFKSVTKNDLWSLFVRLISLFFVESSSEEFPIKERDFLLALDHTNLEAALESYQHMDLNRTGPYRALQLVSILIFIIDSKVINKTKQEANSVKSALKFSFVILGRLIERILKGNLVKSSPLLPAVLVFVEWLVGVERYVLHEEVTSAISIFCNAFVKLLNKLAVDDSDDKIKHRTNIALWEDRELRGFSPISRSLDSLDFGTSGEYICEFNYGNDIRAHRILTAAMKFVEKPSGFRKWISYDIESKKFLEMDHTKSIDLHSEAIEMMSSIVKEEEEEEIIFKPILRYNSAPIYSSSTDDEQSNDNRVTPSNESLRRATSLFTEQIRNFHSEPKSSTAQPANHPSLNAWVLEKEKSNTEKEKATRDFFKPRLSPIDEVNTFSVMNLSLIEDESSLIDYPPCNSAPIPSAPLLPDDDNIWFSENSSSFVDTKSVGILGASPMMSSTYTNRPVMSSSEWLRQFRNQNLNRGNHLVQSMIYAPENIYDRWGFSPSNQNPSPYTYVYSEIPQVYAGPQPGYGYQSFIPYGYMKEKEWQLQEQFQVRGPTPGYMGNN